MSLSRRTFLKLSGLAGGGLMIGAGLSGCNAQVRRMTELAETTGEFSPNVFLTITPEDRVVVAVNKHEMGQGVFHAAATLVSEELEISIHQIDPVHGWNAEFEGLTGFGMQLTGGSTSMSENYLVVRRAAASAREMLVAAAASEWGVRASQCAAKDGEVVNTGNGESIRYGALTRKAAKMDLAEAPKLKKESDFKKIGRESTRVDALPKSTGWAIFGMDVYVPGMVRACVIHPPTFGARAASIDEGGARDVPGVVDIIDFERGVAVVAEKYWQARSAAQKLTIRWKGGVMGGLDTKVLAKAMAKRVEGPASFTARSDGDVEAALEADGVKVLDVLYDVPYLAHAPMEPMNAIAEIDGDKVRIWTGNQSQTIQAEAASRVLGVSRDQVEVETPLLGGGFGRRGVPDVTVEALLLAKRVGRPVHVIWSRESDTRMGYYRPQAVNRMRGGLDKAGKPVALACRSVSQSIFADTTPTMGAIFPDWMPMMAKRLMVRANAGVIASGTVPDFIATEGLTDTKYGAPNILMEHISVRTRVPVCFWRSVGHSFNAFSMEGFVDEMAHAAGQDPVTFRQNFLKDAPRRLAVLKRAAEMGDWGKPIDEGWGRGVAVHKSFGSFVAEVVEAGVFEGQIKVRRVSCAVDCGLAVNPGIVRAQMESGIIFGLSAALKQRIDIVDGVVQQGNFDTYQMLRMHESPKIEIAIMDSKESPTGVGEPGLPPLAPALANAIFAATGVRLRSLPLEDAWRAHTQKEVR